MLSTPTRLRETNEALQGARKELGEAEQFVIFIDDDEDAAE